MAFKLNPLGLPFDIDTSSAGAISIGRPVTGGTAGSILFVDPSTNVGQDNAQLYYDDTNNTVGIGTTRSGAISATNAKTVVKGSGSTSSTSSLDVQNSGGSSTLFVRDDSRVGVGTNTPTTRLHVGVGAASIIGTVTESIAITSTTNDAKVALHLGVPEGTNNRRVQLFLDDATGLYGFESTFSSGNPEFVINASTGERFRVAANQTTFSNASANGVDQTVLFQQNNTAANLLVDLERAGDVRRAALRFKTTTTLNWATGLFRNGGVTQNNFAIGQDDSTLSTAALTIDTSNRVGIGSGTTTLDARFRIVGNNETGGTLSISSSSSSSKGSLIKYGAFSWASMDSSGNHYMSWGMRYDGSTDLWTRTYTAATNFLPYIQLSTLSMVHIGGATSSSTGDSNPTLSPFASFDMVNRRLGLNDSAPTYIFDVQDTGTNGVPSMRVRNTAAAGYAQLQISRVSTSRGAAVTFAVGTTVEWWAGTIYNSGAANTGWSLVPGTTNTTANAVFHVTTSGIFGMGMLASPATYSRLDVNGLLTFGNRDGAGNRASGNLGNSWTSTAGFNYSYLGSSYFDGTNWITNPGTQYGSNYVAEIVQDIQGIKFMTQGNSGNTTRTDSAATFAGYERMRIDASGRVGVNITSPGAFVDIVGSTTSTSSLRIRSGTAPTTPNAGDMWYNGTNLSFSRVGGATEGVLTQSAVTTEAVTSDTTVTVNIGGVTYKLLAKA